VTQAFLSALTRSGGAIVNNVSLAALAPIPLTPAYSISKAAVFSLTQSLRILLAGHDVRVHAVLTGPVDTDMMRDLDIPKASPQAVARAVFDGVGNGEEDIFPDALSASMADSWRDGDLERPEHPNPDHGHLADRKINLTLAAPQPGRKSASQPRLGT
jgi:short-subunit dehydrogenase